MLLIIMKTNAMRLLDAAKIKYETLEYEISMDKFSGEAVTDLLNMDYKECYKTLALKNNRDLYICVVSVDSEIDLKLAAKSIGVKSLEMVHVKDLLNEVGYQRGSVSPIGVKKNKGIFFDEEVNNHETIEISGGQFGIGLKVKKDDLIKFLNAKVVKLV